MKLSIHLVTWNGARYIPALFESLKLEIRDQRSEIRLFVLDNGSTDETVAVLKKELVHFPIPYQLIELKENTGFAGGHDRLFRMSDSDYFLIVNQDMVFEPECIARLVACLDAHPDAAVVAPRLMRLGEESGIRDQRSGIVDSLGLNVYRNRRVVDQYEGRQWSNVRPACRTGRCQTRLPDGQVSDVLEVFGVSGACAMFRRTALNGEFFDTSFGSYKEDVDLAYRLRSAGWRAYMCLDAVAYHVRSAAEGKKKSDKTRYESYRNHLATLYKNEYWQNVLLDFPWILWYEGKKFLYCLFVCPRALRGLADLWRQRKELRGKRRRNIAHRKIGWREMRRWFM